MKFKTLFIINPIAGGKHKGTLPERIMKCLDMEKFEPTFKFSKQVGHASELAKEAVEAGFKHIVAVGGDGTINEVASQLVNTGVTLGVLPFGSGNGLARDLKIPMDLRKSVACLNSYKVETIDAVSFNDRFFFNIAGVGYDALISNAFKYSKKRGFWRYLMLTIKEFRKYSPEFYHIELDGKILEKKAFLISFANSSQYGNNIYISPDSSLNDGVIEMVLVEPVNWKEFIYLGYLMAAKKSKNFTKLSTYSAKHIRLKRNAGGTVHIDGEPLRQKAELDIQIVPLALQVITGTSFNSSK